MLYVTFRGKTMTPMMSNKYYRSSFKNYGFIASNSLFRQPINVLFKIMMAPHYKIWVLFYHFLLTSIIRLHEMTGLKDNCSLLSTINIILASKLSVEVPWDLRKVNDSKVLPNSSLQIVITYCYYRIIR